ATRVFTPAFGTRFAGDSFSGMVLDAARWRTFGTDIFAISQNEVLRFSKAASSPGLNQGYVQSTFGLAGDPAEVSVRAISQIFPAASGAGTGNAAQLEIAGTSAAGSGRWIVALTTGMGAFNGQRGVQFLRIQNGSTTVIGNSPPLQVPPEGLILTLH